MYYIGSGFSDQPDQKDCFCQQPLSYEYLFMLHAGSGDLRSLSFETQSLEYEGIESMQSRRGMRMQLECICRKMLLDRPRTRQSP